MTSRAPPIVFQCWRGQVSTARCAGFSGRIVPGPDFVMTFKDQDPVDLGFGYSLPPDKKDLVFFGGRGSDGFLRKLSSVALGKGVPFGLGRILRLWGFFCSLTHQPNKHVRFVGEGTSHVRGISFESMFVTCVAGFPDGGVVEGACWCLFFRSLRTISPLDALRLLSERQPAHIGSSLW